jgi:hypothetical protein
MLARDGIYDPFTDIDRMIRDPLQIFGNHHRINGIIPVDFVVADGGCDDLFDFSNQSSTSSSVAMVFLAKVRSLLMKDCKAFRIMRLHVSAMGSKGGIG